MPNQRVVITEFYTEIEAQIAQSMLGEFGIETYIIKDDAGGMYPFLQLTSGVKLVVDENLAEEALMILEKNESPEE